MQPSSEREQEDRETDWALAATAAVALEEAMMIHRLHTTTMRRHLNRGHTSLLLERQVSSKVGDQAFGRRHWVEQQLDIWLAIGVIGPSRSGRSLGPKDYGVMVKEAPVGLQGGQGRVGVGVGFRVQVMNRVGIRALDLGEQRGGNNLMTILDICRVSMAFRRRKYHALEFSWMAMPHGGESLLS